MKKNAKKKALATLVALVLVIACAVGATFAWFTDSTAPVENIFTVGSIDITLAEGNNDAVNVAAYDANSNGTLDETEAGNMNTAYDEWLETAAATVVPGDTFAKYTYISNIGKNDACVRVIYTVEADHADIITLSTESAAWDVVQDGNVYTFTLKDVLAAGAVAEALDVVVSFSEDATNQEGDSDPNYLPELEQRTITVYAQAVQADNLVDTTKEDDELLAEIKAALVAGFGA